MYLLHVLGCLMRWHQLVRTLISIGAQSRLICHASLFQLWCVSDCGGLRREKQAGKDFFFCQFVHFL